MKFPDPINPLWNPPVNLTLIKPSCHQSSRPEHPFHSLASSVWALSSLRLRNGWIHCFVGCSEDRSPVRIRPPVYEGFLCGTETQLSHQWQIPPSWLLSSTQSAEPSLPIHGADPLHDHRGSHHKGEWELRPLLCSQGHRARAVFWRQCDAWQTTNILEFIVKGTH